MKLATLAFGLVLCAPAWAIPVTISVVGPDDKPVPDARLRVWTPAAALPGAPAFEKTPTRAVDGQNGRFRFEWDGAFATKDAPIAVEKRRYIFVRVEAPGRATETRAILKADTTIHLQSGRSWGGVVLDADEKPVAGVAVRLDSWSLPGKMDRVPTANAATAPESPGFNAFASDDWAVRATTDAAGRWQMDGLPTNALAKVTLDDPRWVKKSYALRIGAGEAPPLFVKPGATVTGVLVTPDGAPIADAPISTGYGKGDSRTDAQGRFTLSGLAPGEVTLQSYRRGYGAIAKDDPGYVVPALSKVRAVAGQTTDAGTWKAVPGLEVKARIVDENKKPIEGAQIYFYGGGAQVTSDAQGGVTGRIAPDSTRFGGGQIGGVNAPGYVAATVQRPVEGTEKTTLDLGTIELARGVALTGTARVEGETGAATGLPNIQLAKDGGGDSAGIGFYGGNATFTTGALKAGSYQLRVGYGGDSQNKNWEIVSPKTVTVPAPPDKTAGADAPKPEPIEIVLRRLKPGKPPLGEVSGRVVDGNGQGVAGAIIEARLRADDSYSTTSVVSDGDGGFSIDTASSYFTPTSVEIAGIERPGFLWSNSTKVEATTAEGKTTLSDLAMKKGGAIFAGRVLDADGKPAVGAWVVALEARDYAPVQTGPDGTFQMRDLPLDKFTLMAAQGLSVVKIETSASATNVELKLATPPAPDREALANQALEGKLEWWNMEGYWDALGTARVAELATRADGEQQQWNRQQFAATLFKRGPQEFARRAPALMESLKDEARANLEAQLFWLRAGSDNADDRIAANAWLDDQKAVKRQINAQSVTQLLQMAAVAQRLKREDAAGWLDYAAAIAAQLGGGNAEGQGMAGGRWLGLLGYDKVVAFVDGMKPGAEFAVWSAASAGLGQSGDIAGAKKALARMEELAQTPELVEQGKKQNWNTPANQILQARQGVALALAETDADAALEMVPQMGDDWNQINALLVIADRATKADQPAVAERALRLAMKSDSGNVEKFALTASLGERLSPKLGAELWPDALRRALPDKRNDYGGDYQPSVGSWAFYHARLDPAQSRVLVEREWMWRLPAAILNKDKEYSNDGRMLSQLEMGMAAVDPARALEMRAAARVALGDKAGGADVALAAAIVADEKERARLGVDGRY